MAEREASVSVCKVCGAGIYYCGGWAHTHTSGHAAVPESEVQAMSKELDKGIAKAKERGITIGRRLAAGVPETDRPAVRIRDTARRAGIEYLDVESRGSENG